MNSETLLQNSSILPLGSLGNVYGKKIVQLVKRLFNSNSTLHVLAGKYDRNVSVNLIFRGLTWDKREPCDNLIRRFLVEVMFIPEARLWHFINCHPLDRSNHPAIIVRFAIPQHRLIVWQKNGILKSSKFYISEDYPSDVAGFSALLWLEQIT